MMPEMKRLGCCLFLFLLIASLPVLSHAAVHISAVPVEGGGTLQLGRVEPGHEAGKAVRIRVTSDEGKQFQVFQRLQDPLRSASGAQLGQQSFVSYAVGGSNASGTLYAQSAEPLGPADQLIFTSSPDGQSDTVTMAYMIDPARLNADGEFTGRIGYTVRSIGQGFQREAIIPVSVDVKGAWHADVQGRKYRDKIYIGSDGLRNVQDDVTIEFSGNANQDVRIYQEIQEPFVNDTGKLLAPETVETEISADSPDVAHVPSQALSTKRQMIYDGSQDSVKLRAAYALRSESLAEATSGVYRGRILITVDSAFGSQEFPLSVEVDIKPRLDIDVLLPAQGVRFSNLLPTDPPQIKEVTVKVTSNIGRPYMILQRVGSALVNPKGEEIDKQYFLYKTEWIREAQGRLGASEFTPVGVGETPVFYSDKNGSSAEFRVIYRLSYYPGISAGDYEVPIVFSLGEM